MAAIVGVELILFYLWIFCQVYVVPFVEISKVTILILMLFIFYCAWYKV